MQDRNILGAKNYLVYVRLFEGCNIRCDHCFVPSNPNKPSLATIEKSAMELSERLPLDAEVRIQWHGGEPTVLGQKALKDAMDAIETGLKGRKISHGIQTNLLTFDESWIDLYMNRFDGHVGISWDEGIRHLPNGEDFEKAFIDKFDLFMKSGLDPYLIVTFTKKLINKWGNPSLFYKKWQDLGVRNMHFERITKTGAARTNWEALGLTNKEWADAMSKWLGHYVVTQKTHDDGLRVSPFDGMLLSFQNPSHGGYGCSSTACDSRFFTIDEKGLKEGCTAVTSEYDVGGKKTNEWAVVSILKKGQGFQSISNLRHSRTEDCNVCEYKPICSSGCLTVAKFDGSGECSGGKALFDSLKEIVNMEADVGGLRE